MHPQLLLTLLATGLATSTSIPPAAQDKPAPPAAPQDAKPAEEEVRGLLVNERGATDGLTILQPLRSKNVYLVDLEGKVVHTWETSLVPGAWLCLLDDGHLLRGGQKDEKGRFFGGGIGGILQELDWNGTVVWEYELATDERQLHHDFERLPNGNILVIAWENHAREEAIAHGRDPEHSYEVGFWPDVVLELKPVRPRGAEIVWTWRAWDHLVQDRDPAKPHYGLPRNHAGRIDINADHRYENPEETPEEAKKRLALEAQMRGLGYTGGGDDDPPPAAPPKAQAPAPKAGGDATPPKDPPKEPPKKSGDWLHMNAVDYLQSEDLIVLSTPHLCEIWVIDHSTTSAEAATGAGGRRGHGGDLLWRYGNPQMYGHGGPESRNLFYQHDPSWLPGARDGELRLLVFNNGQRRPVKEYSSVEELVLPFDRDHGFTRREGAAFGPSKPAWTYSAPGTFFSGFISGAQRLASGNTLICEGAKGRVFEVTPDGKVVWDFLNPLGGEVEPSAQGGRAPPKALFRATRVPRSHPGLKALAN